MITKHKTAISIFVGSLFLLFVDRYLKFVALEGVDWMEVFLNDRIAFSLPVAWSYILSVLVLVVLLFVLRAIIRSLYKRKFVVAVLWLLLAFGAISNLYDRLVIGAVVDYIRVYNGFFNVADVMIGLSIAALMLYDDADSK